MERVTRLLAAAIVLLLGIAIAAAIVKEPEERAPEALPTFTLPPTTPPAVPTEPGATETPSPAATETPSPAPTESPTPTLPRTGAGGAPAWAVGAMMLGAAALAGAILLRSEA